MTPQRMVRRPARALFVLVACVVSMSAVARAEHPYDQRQEELAGRVIKQGKRPDAVLDLLRMTRHADDADPELSLSLFRRIAETASVDVQHRMYARRRVAWDLRRTGDVPGSLAGFDALGYLRKFRIIGPFDNEGKSGFDTAMGPELHRTEPVNLEESYEGRERQVRFRTMPDVVQGGYVSFDSVFRPAENVCGFAETSFKLDKAKPLTLWIGGGGATKLYFNGDEALRDATYRTPSPDRSVALVQGRAGVNRVLVKTCVTSGTWGFYLRVGDARGEPLVVDADPGLLEAVAPPPAAKTALPKAKAGVLAALEQAAGGEKPSAQALENLARYLTYTGSDDPAERRARQLAQRAAELEPSAARWLLVSALSEERYEKLRFLAKAEALAPDDPDVLIARAQLTSLGPSGERALAMLDKVPARGTGELEAAELKVALLRQLGLTDTALATLLKARDKAPHSTQWMGRELELRTLAPRQDEAIALAREMLKLRYDNVTARRMLLDDALAQGKEGEVLDHMDALRALFPGDEKRLLYLAEGYDALGREDLKLATLKHALEVAPESALLHVRLGRALLRSGQTDAAADALRKALALKPQDAETRELLEQIVPEQRLDESYAVDKNVLLSRRSKDNGHPVSVLQDLTVNTVFDNGLGSRFVQFAAQVHDAEGARRLRARSIQFDPETQRVDIRLARVYRADGRVLEATETYEEQLGEPWYRVYYDTRALVVVFPDLEPGDSVELRYRIDDVAPRNLYADYYGDLHMLSGGEPRAHIEYVLITPAARKFYFNKPKLASLEQTEKVEGSRRIYRFVADQVPALRSEPSMPGLTEVVPYLHVSTYKSWQDVGRWYWGLIHDQLYADDHLKRIVADLKKGAKDERELVQRIYGWVVKNTRYVALEFGIHGYLPYRVPEIVRRGFGDCKDKASLIYTMLREAGVDARLVLVRTRRNGALDEAPASLAAFDHAIAYVPGQKLFLDGTAEHSGTRELPAGDQGVMVLLVGPSSAELTKTPVLAAETNLRTRKMTIELAEDGGGRVSVDERVSGVDAARYRDTFQAEGTRADRLKRQLSTGYPGLTLEESALSGLDDIESDVTIRYRLKAPQLARQEGDELRISATALRDLLRELAAGPTRKFPLDLGVPNAYREERSVRPPSGFNVKLLPAGGSVKSRFGSLTISNEKRGNEVVSITQFEVTVDRVEPGDYAEFRRFVEQADELLRQRIAFARGGR